MNVLFCCMLFHYYACLPVGHVSVLFTGDLSSPIVLPLSPPPSSHGRVEVSARLLLHFFPSLPPTFSQSRFPDRGGGGGGGSDWRRERSIDEVGTTSGINASVDPIN